MTVALVALALLLLLTVALPTLRRLWAFVWFAIKHHFIWLLALRLPPAQRPDRARVLRRMCEDLGPTFIKFGQIVASSSGIFPDRYVREFQKCLDHVRPFAFADVQRILIEELGTERARGLVLEEKPLASASIAQVHGARLPDGTSVVVKVQRPGLAGRIAADMKIMRLVASLLERFTRDAELVNPVGIVDDFAATLGEELDFRLEAKNQDRWNEVMAAQGYSDARAPIPRHELTTPRVLVMERFSGVRIDDVAKVHASGVDAEERLIHGLRAWFQAVVFHGFFHGDVHAGNLMLLDDGALGFLDFGIVGRFDDRQRRLVTDYIVAFATADYAGLARVIVEMGGVREGLDQAAFAKDLAGAYSPLLKLSFAELNYADLIPELHRVSTRHRMKMPREFVLITKQMLYFDRYAKLLAPKLNIFTDPRIVMSLAADVAKIRAAEG